MSDVFVSTSCAKVVELSGAAMGQFFKGGSDIGDTDIRIGRGRESALSGVHGVLLLEMTLRVGK